MKKERIFYLDFIRAISIIIIITYHFAVGLTTQSNAPYIPFLSKGIWGLLGVALFFMISGSSLMYNYGGDEFDIKKYYKKRFLGIYPTYWIAYSIVFLYSFCKFKGLVWSGPIWKLIFSVLGMDGYLSVYTETFGLIGDWFVGCIVLVYIVFPLLRLAMKKFPKLLITASTIVYLLIVLLSDFQMPLNRNLFVALFAFLLGMYYVEYIKDVKLWQAIIAGVIGIIFLAFGTTSEMWKAVLLSNIAAFSIFITLRYIGSKVNQNTVKKIVLYISKYSYTIFLVHHYVIQEVTTYFSGVILDQYGALIVYVMCWAIILGFSKVIFALNKKAMEFFEVKK